MATLEGLATEGQTAAPRGRGRRPILSLTGQSHNSETLTSAQRFEAALWEARNLWSIRSRRLPDDVNAWVVGGSLCGGRRLDRTDADKLLCAGFSAVDRGEVVQ